MPRLYDELESLVDLGFNQFEDLSKNQQDFILKLAIQEEIAKEDAIPYLLVEYLNNPCPDTQSDVLTKFSELDRDWFTKNINQLMGNIVQRWHSEAAARLNDADDYCSSLCNDLRP